jgi:aryl-alcohol dehydrogenase-like predicted oxidoreductase
MIYRDFGKLGWKVSAVGMGAWNIGNQWGEVSDADAPRHHPRRRAG